MVGSFSLTTKTTIEVALKESKKWSIRGVRVKVEQASGVLSELAARK
jgi:hypothetical protein